MNTNTQSFMQRKFGTDFGDVKIHAGGEAIQMNQELNAKAFTLGSDIYFNEGQYNPNSKAGEHLLAQELTHVVQQSAKELPTHIQQKTDPEKRPDSVNEAITEEYPDGCGQTYLSALVGVVFNKATPEEAYQVLEILESLPPKVHMQI